MIRPMAGTDFDWAAQLMERRRAVYERYAPVFWRPAEGITDLHAAFLRHHAGDGGGVGLRSDRGFVVATAGPGRHDVDDFAVLDDDDWATEGRALLEALPEPRTVRVVTARRDAPKQAMLDALGLVATARWWVKELHPSEPAEAATGEVDLGGVPALLVPAPPVYAPGGPVCLLGDLPSAVAVEAAERARDHGAVLAIVTRDRSPEPAPHEEPELQAAGFDDVSAFYEGPLPAA